MPPVLGRLGTLARACCRYSMCSWRRRRRRPRACGSSYAQTTGMSLLQHDRKCTLCSPTCMYVHDERAWCCGCPLLASWGRVLCVWWRAARGGCCNQQRGGPAGWWAVGAAAKAVFRVCTVCTTQGWACGCAWFGLKRGRGVLGCAGCHWLPLVRHCGAMLHVGGLCDPRERAVAI